VTITLSINCTPNSLSTVLKTFFIFVYTVSASKVIFVNFNVNCELYTVCVRKPSKRVKFMDNLDFLKLNLNQFSVFHTSLLTQEQKCMTA